ncbi:hypothetical protein HN011_010751 [Eciton burchellii]|nr:hypothetical protein HN011_010751 [Eciton burchellii]
MGRIAIGSLDGARLSRAAAEGHSEVGMNSHRRADADGLIASTKSRRTRSITGCLDCAQVREISPTWRVVFVGLNRGSNSNSPRTLKSCSVGPRETKAEISRNNLRR